MSAMMAIALAVRYFSFTHSKRDEGYFSHFTRELSATIDKDKVEGVEIGNIDEYLDDILTRVNQRLPDRNLRKEMSPRKRRKTDKNSRESLTLHNYISSKYGLISNIQNEGDVFKTSTPPDFFQLTDRVMNEDENWSKLFNFVPVDGVVRVLDMLPTLFIILGVFGTFIGISMALPEIANINFDNLESSGDTLSEFVVNVTYAMRTSIAGIFFSIVLTLLNTLFPIEATREKTFQKVETVFESLWYHVQTDKNELDQKQELQAIRKVMESLLSVVEGLDNRKGKKAA